MSAGAWVQLAVVAAVLAVGAPLLGRYLAASFSGGPAPGDRVFGPVERVAHRLLGVHPDRQQSWRGYAGSVIAFGAASVLVLYALLRVQHRLPFNPTEAPSVPAPLAFNAAVSFVTGTNWQPYAGETTMSHLSQMSGLVVAQFTAAAVGLSVALAVIRGIVSRAEPGPVPVGLGNFWVDLVRVITRVLLPIASVATLVLVSQGTVQNLRGGTPIRTLEGVDGVIPGGPVATQEVLKTLGTNGGGFFNAGSAHPLANPSGLTNVIQLVLALLIPFALAFAYGRLTGRRRQGHTIAVVMAVLWLAPIFVAGIAEGADDHHLAGIAVEQSAGNLEGKEVRIGTVGSVALSVGTMGTSAGVTPAALASYTPVAGAMALGPIVLGEVSPGGVGTGLYGMLVYVMLAVFFGGLMVGRTPEYLGKKLRAPQMVLVVVFVMIVPAVVLAGTAASVLLDSARSSVLNAGAHGFTEVLYAFASAANGNGSAFAGLNANTDWYNSVLGVVMLVGRFAPMLTILALAGSFAGQRIHAPSPATLPTTGPVFALLLLVVVLLAGGLTYLPALVLGPGAAHLG